MKISKNNLSRPKQPNLPRLRLFHFHNHVGLRKNILELGQDGRAGRFIHVVGKSAGGPGLRLDKNLMPGLAQRLRPHRHHAHAIFIGLDFLGNAYFHSSDSFLELRHRPIRQPQSRHVHKILSILSDQREVMHQRRCGDQQIQIRRWHAPVEESRSNLAEFLGYILGYVQDRHVCHKLLE